MLPDRVSNSGPLTYESGALPTALRGPAFESVTITGKRMCEPSTTTNICIHQLNRQNSMCKIKKQNPVSKCR